MTWLERHTSDGLNTISREDLRDFTYLGQRRPLMDLQQGIYKPRDCTAALSIKTSHRVNSVSRPYDDEMGDDGLFRYKWREESDPAKDSATHWQNVSLRRAMEQRVPLIWFWGVVPSVYKAVFPVYLVGEEWEKHQFIVSADPLQNFEAAGGGLDEVVKRYLERDTRVRIHQPVFRGLVMQAYDTRCAVCALGHSELLDAAHIVPDSDDRGIAAVRNGLALCKIHHAAYDSGILGVTPDVHIEIREDILEEDDGPVLEHGLKKLHGRKLRPPNRRSDRPDPDLLEVQYLKFKERPAGKPDLAFGTGFSTEIIASRPTRT
jgi:putative restriction endonuclease